MTARATTWLGLVLITQGLPALASTSRAKLLKAAPEDVFAAAMAVAMRHSLEALDEHAMRLSFRLELGTNKTFEPSEGYLCNVSVEASVGGKGLLEITVQRIPSLSDWTALSAVPIFLPNEASIREASLARAFIRKVKAELGHSKGRPGRNPPTPGKPPH